MSVLLALLCKVQTCNTIQRQQRQRLRRRNMFVIICSAFVKQSSVCAKSLCLFCPAPIQFFHWTLKLSFSGSEFRADPIELFELVKLTIEVWLGNKLWLGNDLTVHFVKYLTNTRWRRIRYLESESQSWVCG